MLLDKNNRSAEQLRAEHVRNVEYLRCMQEDAFLNERMIEVDDRTNRNFDESVDVAEILDIDKHLGYPKDDCKATEIDAIMKAAKNISLDDIMGVGAACGPSYESTLIFEQAFIEGANLDMIDVCKRATKEYKKQMKSIKAHIKDKKYSLAIRELDELDKSFKTFQNEFKLVDSETVSTTILGYILRSVINACQTILASLITLPIGGVGGAIVVIKFNIENIIGFFKELLKELKDEDDINIKLFNKNRSTILVRMDSMSKQISKMKEAIAEIEKQEKEVKESADEVVVVGKADPIVASNEVEKNPTTVTTEPVDGKKDHDNDETFGQVEPAKGQKFENAADDEGNFEDIDDALKFFDDDYNKSNADTDRDGQRDLEVDVIDKDEVPVLTKANVEETADCEDPSGVKEDNENLEKDAFSFFGLDDIDKDDDGIPDNQDDAEDLPENNKVSFDDAKKMIEFDDDEDNSAMKDVPKLNDPEEKAEEMIQKSAYESFDEFKKLLQF